MEIEKRALRQRLRQRRGGLSATIVEAAARAVHASLVAFPPYQVAVSVIAYLGHENEVATTGILREATRRGQALYLPRYPATSGVIRWRLDDPVTVGIGGVLGPATGVPVQPAAPAIALVPVVAWDRYGGRLGRGGGFYDRLFAELGGEVTRVGLAYEFQEVPGVPRDSWDAPLGYVITERRLVRCECETAAVTFQKGGQVS